VFFLRQLLLLRADPILLAFLIGLAAGSLCWSVGFNWDDYQERLKSCEVQ
jgi:hypothetical protein